MIAGLGASGVIGSGSESDVRWSSFDGDPPFERIRDIDVVDGNLVVRWHLGLAMFLGPEDPWIEVTVTYRWDGTGFVPQTESDVVTGRGST